MTKTFASTISNESNESIDAMLDNMLDAEPADEIIARIATPNLDAWCIVVCSKCKHKINMLNARWVSGELECPSCRHLN